MPTADDLGFVAPELLPGIAASNDAAMPGPFEELAAAVSAARDATYAAEAGIPDANAEAAQEVFQNLEDEYRILLGLRRRREELKEALKVVSAEYEAQRQRMQRAMQAQGTRQFKSTTVTKGGCHFSSVYAVKILEPTTFIPWAKEHCEEILTVNSATLARHVREQYKNRGVPPEDPSFPPGLEVSEHDTLTVSAPKEK